MSDPKGPFSYETIEDKNVRGGYHWRVRDADDNRIATCFVEDNAKFIVERLNAKN